SRGAGAPICVPRAGVARYVTPDGVEAGIGRFDTAPSTAGFLLVARGDAATAWLSRLPARANVRVNTRVTSDTARPFAQAYAVGSRLVHNDVARTGMECRRRYSQPA